MDMSVYVGRYNQQADGFVWKLGGAEKMSQGVGGNLLLDKLGNFGSKKCVPTIFGRPTAQVDGQEAR